MQRKSNFPLLLLWITSLVLSAITLIAWLVNLEIALQIFLPDFSILAHNIPQQIYAPLQGLALDLSTVSTFAPLLLAGFVLVQTTRVLIRGNQSREFAARLQADPYPPHFGFFLVMLGLAGTLYGLLIGLDISGVSELATKAPSSDSIRQSLDKLLAGTATALLSSLVGLIGAFLAAKPIPWLFHKAAGIVAGSNSQTLSATLDRLTRDMQALSLAAQDFTGQLQTESLSGLTARMDAIQQDLAGISQQAATTNSTLERLLAGQQETGNRLATLEKLESTSRDTLAILTNSDRNSELMLKQLTQLNTLLEKLSETSVDNQQAIRQAIQDASATIARGYAENNRHSQAMRRALAAYMAE